MTYFKIPATDDFRNPNEVRQNVDSLTTQLGILQSVADKLQQLQASGGDEAVEQEYGLEAGTGGDFVTLVVSAAGEARPFLAQYISRVG